MFDKKVLGLDIGSKYIKMAFVTKGKKQVVLKTLLATTPEDSVVDGELRNTGTVAARIRAALTENRINPSELYISVNSPNVVVRDIRLPALKANEIDPAIEFELLQSFPGIVQTHTISNKIYSAPNMPVEGIAAFCPDKILNDFVKMSKELGIPLKSIDINANALAKVSSRYADQGQGNGTMVIVDIGYTMSQVNLVSAGQLLLSRQISNGLIGFDRLVANRSGITLEQAELARQNAKYDVYNLDGEDINGFIRIAFSAVEEQIRQLIDYYRYNKAKESDVSEIVLFTGRGISAGLSEYLTDVFKIPVNTLKPYIKSQADESTITMMAAAIGATFVPQDGSRDINLIPRLKELRAAGLKRIKLTRVLAVIVGIALIATGAYTYLNYVTDKAKTDDMLVQAEIIKYSVINQTKTELKARQDQLAGINKVLENFEAGLISNTELFDSISKAMPDSIFSVTYSIAENGEINMNGITKDRPALADFIYTLKQLDCVDSVVLTGVNMRVGEDKKPIDYGFTLTVKLRKAGV
ncbi:MAG TPA: pilus assembly protein PilM [Clostridia bacterium]|nr:pilus assembly protein PilM [Clostridia bacterium]